MNRISSVLRIHLKCKLSWFIMPWVILLGPAFITNFFIAFFVENPLYTGAIASIYIFMFIIGTAVLSDTFPFALCFGVRRTDYFLGTMAMLGIASAISALGLVLLSLIEHFLAAGWGVGLHFFDLPYLNDGSIIETYWIHFSSLVHIFLLGFAISSIYYRFRRFGMYAFFTIATLLFSVGSLVLSYFNLWGTTFSWLARYSAFELSLWAFPVTLGYALFSYLLLRKAIP